MNVIGIFLCKLCDGVSPCIVLSSRLFSSILRSVYLRVNDILYIYIVYPKDYIEKIDFQDIFIAVVNWPIPELYGAFVCLMHYLDQSATN